MANSKHTVALIDRQRETRSGGRKRALLPAVGCDQQGQNKFDCTIRDLSDGGACITFSKGMRVSGPLQIINVRDKLVYEARVVWCRDTQAGVTFTKAGRLADMTTPSSSHLSRFWFERANR